MATELKSTVEFSGHVSSQYDAAALGLISKLEAMGQSVDTMFEMLSQMLNGQFASPDNIKKIDKDINQLEYDVVAELQVIVGNYSPALDELRFLLSTMPMAVSLERLGDIAKANMKRCRQLQQDQAILPDPLKSELLKMVAATRNMLALALKGLRQFDAQMLPAVLEADDQVDAMYVALMNMLKDLPSQHPLVPIVIKNTERAADHALEIARTVHYAHVGRRPKKKHIRQGNV